MNARLQALGTALTNFSSSYLTVLLGVSWIAFLLVSYFLLPIVVMTIGSLFIDSSRSAPAWPTATDYVIMTACLAVMFGSLWMSRLQSKTVARVAALCFVSAGLALMALEARTGASFAFGVWPTWTGSSLLDIQRFLLHFWASPVGWLFVLWFFSSITLTGCALGGDVAHKRAQLGGEGSDERKRDIHSRVTRPRMRLDDLAGMTGLKAQLRGFAANFTGYRSRKAKPSEINGLLLGGPPGNGKTVFAEALAGELGFGFLKIGVKDLASQWVNDTPVKIGEAFSEAIAGAPCVLFLDEIDAVAMNRSGGLQSRTHNEDIKAVNALLQEIDRLRGTLVVLVAASNYVERIDSAVVRPGRFDVRIEIPLPDQDARRGILAAMLRRADLEADEAVTLAVSQLWERRSAAFIESTVKKLRQEMRRQSRRVVSVPDLKAAAREASRKEGAIPRTGTPLSQLVLPESVRAEAESIVYRLRNWEELAERGGTPPTGVLLYGPPGTGKTNLVRAMALELGDWHVFEVKVTQMLADPRSFDKVLEQASEHRPAMVFLDEADDLLRDRSYSGNATATNEIFKAMDGMMGAVPEVVFIAATNSPDAIDAAAKRGGRFAEKIFMDLFEGDDLVAFARSELSRRAKVKFAVDVTPQWIADAFGPIAPADLCAVLGKAINASLTRPGEAGLTRADLLAAFVAILERQPLGAA